MSALEAAPAPVALPFEDKATEDDMVSMPLEPALAPVPVTDTQEKAEDVTFPAPAPISEPEPVAASMPAPVKPQMDISVSLQGSGLVMVETSRDKVPVSPPAEMEVRLGRKPKAPVQLSSEPLMQVETHK